MEFSVGQIVFSKSGKDSGNALVVVNVDEKFVYVCDGKMRPLSNPKRKNPKHLSKTNTIVEKDRIATNPQIKKVLRQFSEE